MPHQTTRREHAPLGSHVLDLDAGDADLERDLLRVLDRLVLLLVLAHLLVHHRRGLADNLVEEDDGALPCAHPKHEPVVDVLEIVRPVVAHQLQDLEELLQV